ncbi:hypothetical protein PENTCL1PPCAC_14670, partial [Pristionchus entomophagus]
ILYANSPFRDCDQCSGIYFVLFSHRPCGATCRNYSCNHYSPTKQDIFENCTVRHLLLSFHQVSDHRKFSRLPSPHQLCHCSCHLKFHRCIIHHPTCVLPRKAGRQHLLSVRRSVQSVTYSSCTCYYRCAHLFATYLETRFSIDSE